MDPVTIAYLVGIPVAILVFAIIDQIYDWTMGEAPLKILGSLLCLIWPVILVIACVGFALYLAFQAISCLARLIVDVLGLV